MSCRHLSVHGCNFESDRRRIVGSSSSIARGALGSYGDRTQGNRANSGGEVVHRLLLGLKCGAPAPAGEQLRTTYTGALLSPARGTTAVAATSARRNAPSKIYHGHLPRLLIYFILNPEFPEQSAPTIKQERNPDL